MKKLITSATDSLLSLISFSNCDNKTVNYIKVNSEAKNMSSGTGNSRSGNAIDSETAYSPVNQPEEEVYTEA